MRSSRRHTLQLVLVVALLLVVGAVATFLVLNREAPAAAESGPRGTLVETRTVERAERAFIIEAQGTVEADREVSLRAQVTGPVVEVAEALEPGRRVSAGAPLVRLDPRDYEIARDRAEAAVAQAEAELALELGRREIAREEWEFFLSRAEAGETAEADRSLALREPQLLAAQARVEEARAGLRRASLDLERTVVRAPFDAIVVSRQTAPGQLVNAQQPLARLVASDALRVRAALPVDRVPDVPLPGPTGREAGGGGAPVTVRFDLGEETVEFSGEVRDLVPALDPSGRMAELLIAVPAPFAEAAAGAAARSVPLLLDAYVMIELERPTTRQLIALPRAAVHHGNEVYRLRDGTLDIVEVEVVWTTSDEIWIDEGLEDGDAVVVSGLSAPVAGMALRQAEDPGEAPAEPADAEEGDDS
jgi:RND family efflux transporter MFP subunit